MILQVVLRGLWFRKAKMAGGLWLGVKVVAVSRCCLAQKFGPKIVNCSEEVTFGNLISRLEGEQFSERRVEKVNIENITSIAMKNI